METYLASTPFGRRRLSHAIMAGNATAQQCPKDAKADKWTIIRNICEARPMIGATDRAVTLLTALLSFFPESELSAEGNLVAFPSNRQLAQRANGMAPATLRRHLANLVDCGLVVRRDSPNGKRFARKGEGGEIEQAYGFDLSPLLVRAAEFERLADEVRRERRELQVVRERITIVRRDIAKMITFGLEEGIEGDWEALHLEYRAIVGRIPRTATRRELEPFEAELSALARATRKLLEQREKSEDSSANESQTERHKQNSNPYTHPESEPRSEKEPGGEAEPIHPPYIQPQRPVGNKSPLGFPLGLVLRACPDIVDYARAGIDSWDDLVEVANLVRAALGVSPDAWNQACEAMGRVDAAIVVAAILQRADQISSAGGYLRALTDKARANAFSVGPVLMALLRAKGRAQQEKTG
ncbi:MAG: replication initiation protein RepC [Rhizobiaceae bacterium]|nr:replication initiation protein RepC [Rhizobiaceae bacterium]